MLTKNNEISKILEKHNIKPSLIRIKILEYIINSKSHPTAHEIYQKLKPQIPTLSKTSVYLNLNLFVNKKIIQNIKTKQEQRFDYIENQHINFYCNQCKVIIDIPLKEIKVNFENDNFIFEKLNIFAEGVCKICAKNRK
ncbi:MAG: Fur family transcriptional regulator [bacterium]